MRQVARWSWASRPLFVRNRHSFDAPPLLPQRRVVVTGLGMVSPLGCGVDVSWRRLIDGHCGVRALKALDLRLNSEDGTAEEVLKQIPSQVVAAVPWGLEAGQFNSELWLKDKQIAPFIGYALCAAKEALDDANWHPSVQEAWERTGVAIGGGIGSISDIVEAAQLIHEKRCRRISPFFVPRILINMAAGHVSIKHGLKGPNHAAVTACASAAHSIGDASRMIRFGDADVMVAGGSECSIDALSMAGFCRARALSTKYNAHPERSSRPFDCDRDGFVMGEGAGIMILEEFEHAKARNARIYAEVRGYGMSGDANHITQPSNDGRGAILSMTRALQQVIRCFVSQAALITITFSRAWNRIRSTTSTLMQRQRHWETRSKLRRLPVCSRNMLQAGVSLCRLRKLELYSSFFFFFLKKVLPGSYWTSAWRVRSSGSHLFRARIAPQYCTTVAEPGALRPRFPRRIRSPDQHQTDADSSSSQQLIRLWWYKCMSHFWNSTSKLTKQARKSITGEPSCFPCISCMLLLKSFYTRLSEAVVFVPKVAVLGAGVLEAHPGTHGQSSRVAEVAFDGVQASSAVTVFCLGKAGSEAEHLVRLLALLVAEAAHRRPGCPLQQCLVHAPQIGHEHAAFFGFASVVVDDVWRSILRTLLGQVLAVVVVVVVVSCLAKLRMH